MIYYISTDFFIYQPPVHPISIGKSIELISPHETISIDTETTGLNFMIDKMLLLQIGAGDDQFIFNAKDDLTPLIPILTSDKLKILHNVKFDYKFIRQHLNISLENVWDTYLA